MEPKPNWLVRHINLITTAVALYPWLLMILLLWDNQRHHQHGYAALGAAIGDIISAGPDVRHESSHLLAGDFFVPAVPPHRWPAAQQSAFSP
ncbi:Uncharacterised protein [Klebsiella pneumoniae]|uniref:Uncharacterized protein n=1 Tax=Klebsiella pneumoniae TaxID=573 RepID=A0A4P0YF62_KLEPN|nr:Uncharacterised protein [Klebsiella pneumoniae]